MDDMYQTSAPTAADRKARREEIKKRCREQKENENRQQRVIDALKRISAEDLLHQLTVLEYFVVQIQYPSIPGSDFWADRQVEAILKKHGFL